jgi:alkylation response protein AidB-like acyl-CoA dehydrogenase
LLAAPAFLQHGSDQQRARFLPRILHQKDIWCQGFSEPNAGSDLAGVQTTARRDGENYVVTGQKIWTSFGHYADWCLLLARTSSETRKHRGLTMFAMPMHQAGVQPHPIRQLTGDSEFAEVFYDNAEVPVACRVGGEGEGWQVAMTVLTAERGAGFAALALNRLSDMFGVLGHCASGRPDAMAQERRLGDRMEVTRWHVMRAIETGAANRDAMPPMSIMHLLTSELEQEMARTGFEVSCAEHTNLWRVLELEARPGTIASGTAEIQRNIIGERILGLPR